MPGRVWALVGPSGSGKTTLAKDLASQLPGLVRAITATTRPPRPGEREGIDYRFLTEHSFQELASNGALAEQTCYGGHQYGLPVDQLSVLEQADLVAVVDAEGIRHLRALLGRDSVRVVFLEVPEASLLAARMTERGSSAEEVARRMVTVEAEQAMRDLSDEVVVVGDYRATYEAIARLIQGSGGI